MKRFFAALPLLGLAAVLTLGASSCSSTSSGVAVSSAPPPPTITLTTEPQWTLLSDRNVYVINEDAYSYDMFRSGTDYYLYADGYWYRASAYNGPYVVVETTVVPQTIFDIDDKQYRWRRHPTGWRGGS